jgi:hypothetical protein
VATPRSSPRSSARSRFTALVLEGESDRATLEKALSTVLVERIKPSAIAKEKAAELLMKTFLSIMDHFSVFALRIAPEGTGVEDIPSPACMETHLPKDRKWTDADIEQAWNTCLKNTSK